MTTVATIYITSILLSGLTIGIINTLNIFVAKNNYQMEDILEDMSMFRVAVFVPAFNLCIALYYLWDYVTEWNELPKTRKWFEYLPTFFNPKYEFESFGYMKSLKLYWKFWGIKYQVINGVTNIANLDYRVVQRLF